MIKEYYTAFTVKCGNEKVLVKVKDIGRSSLRTVYDYIGRRVRVAGSISIPSGRRNPKGFDYRQYLKGKNIFTICETNQYKIKAYEVVYPVRHLISLIKSAFYDAADGYLSDEDFAMTAGILFGETSYLDDDVYDSFRNNGIAHILAVSGLHVNMVYDLLRKLFRKKTPLIDIFGILLISAYAVLSNFSTSVLRASFMIIMKIAAFHLDRRYDSLSAISLIAAVMLLSDPYLIYSSGMQLSFCAAYSMAIVSPWVTNKAAFLADKRKSDLLYKTGKAAAPGLSVFAGTAPLCAYHFLTFTPLSMIINPFAIALAGIILPAGLLGLAASCLVPAPVSDLFIYLDCSLLSLLLKALGLLTKAGTMFAGSTSVCAPPAALLILYYAFLFFLLSEGRYILHRTRRYFELALIEILLLTAGSALPFALKISDSIFPWEYGTAKITFLDVGQGDCIHIHYGGKDILIDGGGSYYSNIAEDTIKPYLLKNGIKDIDLAIVTHEDQDHCKGIYELDEIFEIDKIVTNKDVYGVKTEDENDSCIVSSIEIDGAVFLLMSDADTYREDYLLSAYPGLECDVLKAGHHGSAGSSRKIHPQRISVLYSIIGWKEQQLRAPCAQSN